MFKWTVRFLIATPFLMITTILLAGGGHGFMQPIVYTYPIAFIFKNYINDDVALALMFLQFPFYGLIIDISNRFFQRIIFGLVLAMALHFFMLLRAIESVDL